MRLRSASCESSIAADRHRHPLEAVRAAQRKALHRQRAPIRPARWRRSRAPGGRASPGRNARPRRIDPIFAAGGNGLDGQTQVDQRGLGALGHVVGDARLEQDVDQPAAIGGFGPALSRGRLTDLDARSSFRPRDRATTARPPVQRLMVAGRFGSETIGPTRSRQSSRHAGSAPRAASAPPSRST